jgi:hypothetical protein
MTVIIICVNTQRAVIQLGMISGDIAHEMDFQSCYGIKI